MAEQNVRIGVNTVEIEGTVSEYDLTVKQCERKCFIDNEETTVRSAMIYGRVSISVNGTPIEVSVMSNKHTKSGDESKTFKGLCSLAGIKYGLDESTNTIVYTRDNEKLLKPIIGGKSTLIPFNKNKEEAKKNADIKKVEGVGVNASRVVCNGSLDRNIFLNRDRSDLRVDRRIAVTRISTTDVSGEDKAVFKVEGYVKDSFDERDNGGNATGRHILELVNVGFFGCNVFELVIPSEWTILNSKGKEVKITAEQYLELAKKGATIMAKGHIEGTTYGRVEQSSSTKVSLGEEVEVSSGYTVIEWITKGLDVDPQSPDNYKKEEIDKLVEEYQVFLDAQYNKLLEDANKRDSNNATTSNRGSSRNLGARNNTQAQVVDADDPFADPFA